MQRSRRWRAREGAPLGLAFVTATACAGPTPLDPLRPSLDDDGTTGSTDGVGYSSATTGGPDTESSDDGSGDPASFVTELDVDGSNLRCSMFVQDCPAGTKCSPWASDGGGTWNATRCVPVVPDPDQAGEPCTVEGSATTGLDTCDVGAMCWDVHPMTLEGTCWDFCSGGPEHPICLDPAMQCTGREIPLCRPTCCPLEQDCPEGQGCYPITHQFACAPDASGDIGGYGDPCEFINVCEPGLACLGADAIPDCSGNVGCCTALCDTERLSCTLLHPDLECSPWYEEAQAPPGLEQLGACALP